MRKIIVSNNSSKSRDLNMVAAKTNNVFMKNEGVVDGAALK